MYCLEGSLLWQEILGDGFLGKKQQHVITEADSFFKNEKVLIDFKCSQLKSLLKCGYFFWDTTFWHPTLKRVYGKDLVGVFQE